ncbi:MAG TPA: M1 family metallopeptidase [Ohtaekwangia sp.]
MKRILSLLLLTLLYSTGSHAFPPADNIDVKHYSFQLELNDSTDRISGTATIQIVLRSTLQTFSLDLANRNDKGAGMVVSDVTFTGKAITFTHQQNKLHITLPTAGHAGDLITVVIRYSGIPQDGLIISKNKFGDRTFFGDNWPDRAHQWLPTVDHPSDKASVDFIVTAPTVYEVIGNGIKVEESYLNRKQKLTHWQERVDIPTKVMVIGAARFAIHLEGDISGIPVESWVYPQNRLDGFHDYAVALKVLEYFHKHIGPYPYKKLANVQSKTRYGGMENASNIFYFENSVNGMAGQEDLIAHEIAHQWFGNSASETDWHHIWLSEGFATYFSHLYAEYAHGKDSLTDAMITARNKVIDFYKTTPLPIVFTELPNDLLEILSINSYQKGGWVLHMLRNEVGDEVFWKGIRNYYQTFQNRNAQTSDFLKIMEEASGKDLSIFFQQWLFRAGHPVLEGSWTYDARSKTLNLAINQIQPGQPFDFVLEVGIFQGNPQNRHIEKLKINKAANKFTIPVGTKPLRIELDPDTKLLFEGKLKN